MSTSDNNSINGIGFIALLTGVFTGLKLTDNIDWSWWWVLSPIWISVSFIVIGFLIAFAYYVITE